MKKLFFVLSGTVLISTLVSFSGNGNDPLYSSGAPAGYANDPSGGNATCRSCHTGAPLGNLSGVISSTIPPAGYTPGTTYAVTANVVRAGHTRYGFEISPQNSAGTLMGTLVNTSTETQVTGTGNKYITHTSTGTGGTGSRSWSFNWTAPASGSGPVTFYGAFNVTNHNNSSSGDSIFVSTLAVAENTTAVEDIQKNDLSFTAFPDPAVDLIQIRFELEQPSPVELDLMDINGNKVAALLSEKGMSGSIHRSFDLSSYSKGIYFICLNADGIVSTKRVVKL